MNLISNRTKLLISAVSLTLSAVVPLTAAERHHVIEPLAKVTITGTVTDAQSGLPVSQPEVTNGSIVFTGKTDGTFSIDVPAGRPTVITAQRWGYNAASQTITPTKAQALNFQLSGLPVITVKDAAGATHVVDYGVSQFGYLVPFSGYVKSDNANFCKPDGTAFTPNKSEFSKILGPGTSATISACCKLGPVVAVNVEMKDGTKSVVYFNDSCFGNEVDFIGRDRGNGQFIYLNFTNIAEIDFP